MNRLVRWRVDFGRFGVLEGLRILDEYEWSNWKLAEEKRLEFWHHDCLGKHSEVCVTIDQDDYVVVSEDQDFISKLKDLLGSHISGFWPFDEYMLEEALEGRGDEDE